MRPGAGIPYDMGGYYLHEMFNMFGPVSRASGFCFTREAHRPYLNPNHTKFREDFFVETPNTLTAALEFRNGFYAAIAMSSDCFGGDNLFEIHGTDGTLSVGDPNNFGDPVYITRNGGEKTVFPMTHPYCENSRGIGAAELAWSVRAERPHRLSAEMGYHALEIIEALQVCTRDNQTKLFDTDFQRPRALSAHWVDHPQCKELVLAD